MNLNNVPLPLGLKNASTLLRRQFFHGMYSVFCTSHIPQAACNIAPKIQKLSSHAGKTRFSYANTSPQTCARNNFCNLQCFLAHFQHRFWPPKVCHGYRRKNVSAFPTLSVITLPLPRHSPTPSSPFTVGLMFTLFWVYVGPSWDYVGANLVLAGVLVVLLVVLFRFSLGNATVGRPRSVWESKIHRFCRYKLLGNWVDLAKSDVWIDMIDDFVSFCLPHQWKWRYICFNFRLLCHFRLRPKKARRTAFKHEMKCKKILCIVNVCVIIFNQEPFLAVRC